jgi:hypothetical protein
VRRWTSPGVWALAALSVVLWVGSAALWHAIDVAHVPTPGREQVGLLVEISLAVLVFGVTGGLIALRRPENPIGWILAGAAFLITVKACTGIYVDYGHYVHAGIPLWTLAAWLSNWSWIPAVGSYGTFLFLLFPTGRPPSRRWRWAGWLACAAITLAIVSVAFAPGKLDQFRYIENPLAAPGWLRGVIAAANVGFPLLPLSAAACVASIVARYRRAGPVERAQIKWVAFAGAFLVVGLVIDVGFNRFDQVTAPLIFGPFAAIAIACMLAIQRYRLFEIDQIITRTLSYAIISATLAGMYALIALVPTAIFRTGHVPSGLVAGAVLVVAALFRPVRRRVQNAVDHRFNRRRYDAEQTIDAFSVRLRDQIDIDTLRTDLETLVHHTMEPRHVSLWLRES